MNNGNHRVFLAINFSEEIKNKFSQFQKEWVGLPVRLTKKKNLHLTLLFIGNIDTEEIFNFCRTAQKTTSQHEAFEIRFNKICFGPVNKKPRMIWALGEKNKYLSFLKNDLEKSFFNLNENKIDNKGFCPHITLARINRKEWGKMENKAEIDKNISISFLADSIEVMESVLLKTGPEYSVLESILLK